MSSFTNPGRGLFAVALVCWSGVFSGSATAEPVIDDEKLERQFARGVRQMPEKGNLTTGRQVAAALREAEGRKTKLPAATVEAPVRSATDYGTVRESVVVIGTAEQCAECDDWHMGVVSTGWVIGPDGLIATSYHVLEEETEDRLGVMTAEGKVFPVREVVAADRDGDAALLRIGGAGNGLPWLPLAAQAKTGGTVRVVGHPDGRFYSLTDGLVSRVFVGPLEEGSERKIWVTVTADYGAGSSGAPVLDADGEVVGMVSSTATLLADPEEGQDSRPEDVQMVFKDCVSVETMRGLLED